MVSVYGWVADYSGCGYYRIVGPMTAAREHGVDTQWGHILKPADHRDTDVIVGQRVCLPGPSHIWQELAASGRHKMVYELDDDLFDIPPSNERAFNFYMKPGIQENIRRNIDVADEVIVSTPRLAEVVSQLNDQVHVVPNYVPAWLLDWERPRTEHLTLGWAGSMSHAMDFEEIGPQIARLMKQLPHLHYHAIGGMFPSYERRMPKDRTRVTTWVPTVQEYYQKVDFDIGLAPLRPHLFNRSKSHIKALEYAALGIPVVASNVGPYSTFVLDGETGFLSDTPHQFIARSRQLIADDDDREWMGRQAREYARGYTIEGHVHEHIDVWKG